MTNRTAVLVLFGVALLPGVGRAAPKPPTLCAGVTACSAAAETTGTAAGSTGTAAPSTQGIKYHPGHYAALDGMLRASNRSTLMAEHMRQIEELANEPNIVGVQLYVQWSALEGDTPGDYAAGIQMLKSYLAALAPIKKRLMVALIHVQFGGYPPSDLSQFFPSYIWKNPSGQYGATAMRNGITARVWQQATMDRVIDQVQAYGKQFDSDPYFEMVALGETSVATDAGVDGFSQENLLAQFKRLYTASRAVWPNTSIRLTANYVGSDAQTVDLIKFCAALKCAVGGPDVIPSEDIQANRVFSGGGGGTDYRGILPFVAEVQSPELGGHEGTWTPAQLYDHSIKGNASVGINGTHPQYFVWLRNTWSGGAAQQWSTGILPFVQSIKGAVASTACPSAYTSGCRSQ